MRKVTAVVLEVGASSMVCSTALGDLSSQQPLQLALSALHCRAVSTPVQRSLTSEWGRWLETYERSQDRRPSGGFACGRIRAQRNSGAGVYKLRYNRLSHNLC
jgi:hypothetical protein